MLPQIRVVIVRLLLNNLGSHVQQRPLDGCQQVRVDSHRLGEPKVAKFGHFVEADKDVLWHDVSMKDSVGVEEVEGGHQVASYRLHMRH